MRANVAERAAGARAADLGRELQQHRRLLWSIAYRMTGVAADADDVVQGTFERALAKPPARDRPIKAWLVKVAMNLARDALRRRRRTPYVGTWLPSPVDDERLEVEPVDERPSAETRYSRRESATFAFLVALEALTPQRRAVLILRDVFDYSTEETAEALGMTNDAVKQSLVRARRALAQYDAQREPFTLERSARDEGALTRLLSALASGDADAVVALLSEDVEAWSDGGGEFAAAKVIVRGPAKVALVYRNLAKLHATLGGEISADLRRMNATTQLLLVSTLARTVISVETDGDGKIRRIYSVLASRKLTALTGQSAGDVSVS